MRGTRGARGAKILAVAAICVGALAACGGGGGGSDAGTTTTTGPKLPAACKKPPTTIDLQAGGAAAAGSSTFEVSHAAARRVAILPGEMAFDPADLSGLEKKAAVSPLALYTLYLADFGLSESALSGVSPNPITPGKGQTVGALTLIPTTEAGFTEGQVVTDGELDYETTTTFRPLGLTVYADGNTTGQAYTDVKGQATILQLSEDTICVDFDVTLENQGEMVYEAKGAVLAPVVRSADAFFYT